MPGLLGVAANLLLEVGPDNKISTSLASSMKKKTHKSASTFSSAANFLLAIFALLEQYEREGEVVM